MFDQKIAKLEKDLETSAKLLPLLKKQFIKRQESLTTIMADWTGAKFSLCSWERILFSWIIGKQRGSLRWWLNCTKS